MNRDKWILDATERIEDILSETDKSVDTWELIYHLLHELGIEECEPDDEGGRYFYIDVIQGLEMDGIIVMRRKT